MMNTSPNDKVPYTSPAWLDKFLDEIRKSPPTKVDVKWVQEELGLSVTNARNFVRVLRQYELINEEGGLTELGPALRGDKTETEYIDTAKAVLTKTYPNLMSKLDSDPAFDMTKLRAHFRVANPKLGQSGVNQATRTFRWWLVQAQREDLEEKIWGTKMRAGAPTEAASKKREPTPPKRKVKALAGAAVTEASVATRLGALSSILRINIDSTWDDERLRQLFRRLDRLLKGEEQDE